LIEITGVGVVKNFGRIHTDMNSGYQRIFSTEDGKWLFTTNDEGGLKQFNIKKRAIAADLGNVGYDIAAGNGVWTQQIKPSYDLKFYVSAIGGLNKKALD
jgi:hypothetical protein